MSLEDKIKDALDDRAAHQREMGKRPDQYTNAYLRHYAEVTEGMSNAWSWALRWLEESPRERQRPTDLIEAGKTAADMMERDHRDCDRSCPHVDARRSLESAIAAEEAKDE